MTIDTSPLRSPQTEFTGPPRDWYFGEEWFRRDIEAVFRPRWQVAAHAEQLPEPGDFRTYAIGDHQCVIVRDRDGRIAAYQNVCSHRGAQLCTAPSGTLPGRRAIVCGYHGWTFSPTDGAVQGAPAMHEDFDRSAWGLQPVHVDEWLGLILVCFDDDPPPTMAEQLGVNDFNGYLPDGIRLAEARTFRFEANWKIIAENNNECYHCAMNHPELTSSIDWRSMELHGDFEEYVGGRAAATDARHSPSIGEATLTIGNGSVCAVPLPQTDPSPDAEKKTWGASWEPGCGVRLSYEHGFVQIVRPTGPATTEVDTYWLVAKDAVEGRDYDLAEFTELWDATVQQDRDLCEMVQRGMQNPAYRPGPLNRRHQASNAGFLSWYETQIAARFPEVFAELA
ncbi:aromatic ring-hydroxylating dioxygenase subunit alpha [Microbacterium sp. X-17]|uniref:aromatic ring-hydroxylating oxygenase subunit alpha n=1 Tax=Microbacterium sp. X-17 TaxID=3144404 RepID=UPI0031F4BEA8